jgi:hypothetical protein
MQLAVSDEGLRSEAGSSEALAGKLASNGPPAVTGSSGMASAAVVDATHARIAAAGMRCAFRVQATATKLLATARRFTDNEASSAAGFAAIAASTVS